MDIRENPLRDPPSDQECSTGATFFAGLPDSIENRFEFVRLAREIGTAGGWTPALVEHLELLLEWSRPQDWEASARPVVWLSVNATAAQLGVCPATVRNHERAMEALGAIKVTAVGNGRRCGRRGEDGAIVWAWGVDLAPLPAILPRLRKEAAEQRRRNDVFVQARHEALDLQRRLREAIDAAVGRGAGDRGALALRDRIRRIGQKWGRRRRIEGVLAWCRMLERLLALVTRAFGGQAARSEDTVASRGTAFARSVAAEIAESTASKPAEGGGREAEASNSRNGNFRPMQPDFSMQVNYLPIAADSYQVSPEASDKAPSQPPGHAAGGNGLQGRRTDGARNPAGGGGGAARARNEKVPIAAIAELAAASDLVWVADPDNWNALVDAAYRASGVLGIQQASWADACRVLGRYPAAAAVILIALKFERNKVRLPDGYLRAMTCRALEGRLHLATSVFGWLIEVGKAVARPAGRGAAAQ